jgi:hypothetical protein
LTRDPQHGDTARSHLERAMKALVVLVAAAILVGSAYFYFGADAAKETRTLAVGFGKPDSSGVEMNVAVSMFLPRKDPPKFKDNIPQWDQWVAEHFQVVDSSGAKVPLQRANSSSLLSDRQSGGTPECWLKARLKPGGSYVFTFIPSLPGPKFKHMFTAPTTQIEPEWFDFEDAGE